MSPFWDTTAPDKVTMMVAVVLVAVFWRANSLTCKLEAFTASENCSTKISLSRSRVAVITKGGTKSAVKLLTSRGTSASIPMRSLLKTSTTAPSLIERYVLSSFVARFVSSLMLLRSSSPSCRTSIVLSLLTRVVLDVNV